MMGFKDFRCARIILAEIEVMHMIRKWQMRDDGISRNPAEQSYSVMMQVVLFISELARPALLIATQPRILPQRLTATLPMTSDIHALPSTPRDMEHYGFHNLANPRHIG